MKKNLYLIIVLFPIFLVCCDNPEKSFNKGLQSRLLEDFQRVMNKYPDSKFSQLAEIRMGEINYWQEIDSSLSEINYQTYLDSFPDGLFQVEANVFLKLIEEYQKARKEDIIDSYAAFQESFPNSLFQDSIEKRLKLLKPALIGFQTLKDKDDIPALNSYVREFEGTGYAKIIEAKVDSLILFQTIDQLSVRDVVERANAIEKLGELKSKALKAVPHLISLLNDNSGFWIRTDWYMLKTSISSHAEEALTDITGQDFGKSKSKWSKWWEEENQENRNTLQDSIKTVN